MEKDSYLMNWRRILLSMLERIKGLIMMETILTGLHIQMIKF